MSGTSGYMGQQDAFAFSPVIRLFQAPFFRPHHVQNESNRINVNITDCNPTKETRSKFVEADISSSQGRIKIRFKKATASP